MLPAKTFLKELCYIKGGTTLNIATFIITTFSIMAFSITTLSIMTYSITTSSVTKLSIMAEHSYAKCHLC